MESKLAPKHLMHKVFRAMLYSNPVDYKKSKRYLEPITISINTVDGINSESNWLYLCMKDK